MTVGGRGWRVRPPRGEGVAGKGGAGRATRSAVARASLIARSAPGRSWAASAWRATPMSSTARRSSGSCVLFVPTARSRSRVSARSRASSASPVCPRSTADRAASRKACGGSFSGTGGSGNRGAMAEDGPSGARLRAPTSAAASGDRRAARGPCRRSRTSRCRPQRSELALAWGDLISVTVRRGSCARPVRRQMRAARTKSRLVRKQPGFRRRARREGVERKLDAEFPAGGMDLQDLVG